MINTLISIADNEKIKVYRNVETVTDKGGTKKVQTLIKDDLTVSIQTSGSTHSVGGLEVINNIAGKTGKAVYIVYSPRFPFIEKDLIVRSKDVMLTDEDVIFEVQSVEHNGRGTLLQHDKYYIVEYDNQKVLG